MNNTCYEITYFRPNIIFLLEFNKMGKKLHLIKHDGGPTEYDQYLIMDTKTRNKVFITVNLAKFILSKYTTS